MNSNSKRVQEERWDNFEWPQILGHPISSSFNIIRNRDDFYFYFFQSRISLGNNCTTVVFTCRQISQDRLNVIKMGSCTNVGIKDFN